ncbi:H(+)-transporting two-sector ATPase [Candidatus Moduliflexus flocculans]|uniref:H(+)-transporting two-sector ATPase n=1 Tax=Candidatus Moduliflexus flocculans TaxID=1499966 RepID=A0A081BTD5_9BACT|nr:H(+)-transporting two-sector ATPase [Candidatus Moduliflexus flocculans]
MFKPLEMVKVVLQILHSDGAKVTHVIAKQGLLHLLDSHAQSKESDTLFPDDPQQLITQYATLDQELKTLFQQLSLGRTIQKEISVEPAKEVNAIQDAVERIRKALQNVSNQILSIERHRDEKRSQANLLKSVASVAVDLRTYEQFAYFHKVIGFIETKDISRFEASLASTHFMIVPLTTIDRRSLIIVFCSPKDRDIIERALKSSFFEEVSIPSLTQGSVEETISNLEAEARELDAKKADLSKELRETQQEVVKELQTLREKVSLALVILKAQLLYARGSRSYLIQGWVPKDRIATLQQEVLRVTEGRARFDVSDPEMIEDVRQGKLKIPILFNNPYLIRPFETLVFNYGTQDYKEVDVTPFVAVSFLLMFGMMFGDVGHGAILFGLGYLLFSKFYQFLDYAIIVMECGVSSIIFGLLYGSIFGVEDWIPALWFRPAENINYFMTVAGILGMVVISGGIVLNIINSFRLKDYASGILGHYGIVGGLFYWTAIGLGLKYAIYGNLGVSTEALILLLGLPLGVMFFREPLEHIFFSAHKHDGKMFPSGVFMFLLESAIDTADVVVHYVAGTVSFLRTAAFALAHGGLMIAIFTLTDMLSNVTGSGLWQTIIIILGNVLVIALEGLVVSIQTVRLEYYEFFTKFFKGGGERFQPLKLD